MWLNSAMCKMSNIQIDPVYIRQLENIKYILSACKASHTLYMFLANHLTGMISESHALQTRNHRTVWASNFANIQ